MTGWKNNPGAYSVWCPGCREHIQEWQTSVTPLPPTDKAPPWVFDDMRWTRICTACGSECRGATLFEIEAELEREGVNPHDAENVNETTDERNEG